MATIVGATCRMSPPDRLAVGPVASRLALVAEAQARAINDNGTCSTIVGSSPATGGAGFAVNVCRSVYAPLTLGGFTGQALGVNDGANVVGWSYNTTGIARGSTQTLGLTRIGALPLSSGDTKHFATSVNVCGLIDG